MDPAVLTGAKKPIKTGASVGMTGGEKRVAVEIRRIPAIMFTGRMESANKARKFIKETRRFEVIWGEQGG